MQVSTNPFQQQYMDLDAAVAAALAEKQRLTDEEKPLLNKVDFTNWPKLHPRLGWANGENALRLQGRTIWVNAGRDRDIAVLPCLKAEWPSIETWRFAAGSFPERVTFAEVVGYLALTSMVNATVDS